MSLFQSAALAKISFAPGRREKGRWIEGAETRTEFRGSWQPASGQDMQKLDEGKRSGETWKCYAPVALDFTAADAARGVSGDRVEAGGMRYEVILAAKWANGILPHWELLCQREKEGGT